VLFPFDECHSVEFKVCKRGMQTPMFIGHLGRVNTVIEITANSAICPEKSSTDNFDKLVLDLTGTLISTNAHMPTHGSIKLKDEDNWGNKGLLMRIHNAVFDIVDFLPPKN